MLKLKQHLNEDTLDNFDINGLNVWLRIDGGKPNYWEVVIFHGEETIKTFRYSNQVDATTKFLNLTHALRD